MFGLTPIRKEAAIYMTNRQPNVPVGGAIHIGTSKMPSCIDFKIFGRVNRFHMSRTRIH